MKKSLLLLLVLLLATSLVACGQKGEDQESSLGGQGSMEEEVATIEDYFPFVENRLMKYQGRGNEFAERESFVEYIEDKKIQIKTTNPGTTFVRVLENKDGILRQVFSEGEFYHIENMLNANINSDRILLKEPLEVGNTWEDGEGNEVSITSLNQEIDTPLGTYQALEVVTHYQEGGLNKDYYVKDIGLVASLYEDGGFVVETLLESIETKGLDIEIDTYYPTRDDIGSELVSQSIAFRTNDSLEKILENLMKNPPGDNLFPVISKETEVKEIHLNRNRWILEIDLSEEAQDYIMTGIGLETEILQSLVNTLGKFYDVDKVYITIGGKPYESGHYMLREDDFFTVNTDIDE